MIASSCTSGKQIFFSDIAHAWSYIIGSVFWTILLHFIWHKYVLESSLGVILFLISRGCSWTIIANSAGCNAAPMALSSLLLILQYSIFHCQLSKAVIMRRCNCLCFCCEVITSYNIDQDWSSFHSITFIVISIVTDDIVFIIYHYAIIYIEANWSRGSLQVRAFTIFQQCSRG